MVASSTVTLRPPSMPSTMDAETIRRKGLSRANNSLIAPRVGLVMEDSCFDAEGVPVLKENEWSGSFFN